MIVIFSNLRVEIALIGLLPGFLLNWFVEQMLIEIRNEPYFELGDFSDVFNCIFYSIVFFPVFKSLTIFINVSQNNEKQISKKCAE